jgi:hypothetical protein
MVLNPILFDVIAESAWDHIAPHVSVATSSFFSSLLSLPYLSPFSALQGPRCLGGVGGDGGYGRRGGGGGGVAGGRPSSSRRPTRRKTSARRPVTLTAAARRSAAAWSG